MDSTKDTPWLARRITSSALLDLGAAASKGLTRIWVSVPAAGSPAGLIFAGRSINDTAFTDLSLMLASATDHYHAMARLMRMEDQFGPAIATLTRGFIEASGRGWWLLEAVRSPDRFAHRAAALTLSEVGNVVRHGGPLERHFNDGTRLTMTTTDFEASAREGFDSVNMGESAKVPGYTALAQLVLNAARIPEPGALYSHLSGVAHGEGTSVGGLGGSGRLGLPIRNFNVYLSAITHVLDLVVAEVAEVWGATQELERWSQTRERVWNTLAAIDTSLLDSATSEVRIGTLAGGSIQLSFTD